MTWHAAPDRTDDPRIKRSAVSKLVIAAFRRGSRGRSYQFLRVLSVNRRLFRPFLALNARMMPRGKLPRIETEAVILFTAARCGSKYEWTQHKALGRRAGLTADQIELIGSDPQNEQLDERLRLVLRAAGEILDDRILSDETWDALSARYSPDLILELVMLTGNYAMLAGALNTFGVPLEAAWRK
ncbi:MAG: carboxymuconolactone decarboxylase family protein [Solirubrobacterales bacterium]